jgi:cytidyltransferase-like protein
MMDAKKLFALQVKEGGISQKDFQNFSDSEKALLVEREGKYYLNQAERTRIRVGLMGGAFDIVHMGHVFTLNEARKYCDVLVVAVARDELILKKGRKPVHSQEYRAAMVEFLKPVDVALLGGKDYKELLENVKPNVIIYGYDQEEFAKPPGVEIIKLKKHIEPEKFKSSKIIKES